MECFTVPDILQLLRTPGPPSSDVRDELTNTLAISQYRRYVYQEDHYQFVIDAVESLHAPWRRLPPELLSDIFIHCLPKETKLRMGEAPFLLTRVCWAWYQVVVATPKLWSNILLTFPFEFSPGSLDAGTQYLRLCIFRAKGVPLHIQLHPEFITHPVSYRLIRKSSHQIQSLSIWDPTPPNDDGEIPEDYFGDLSPELSTPNLTSLEIISNQILSSYDFAHLQHLVQSACNLKRYIFCSRSLQDFGPIPTAWSTIGELRLTDPLSCTLCSQILRHAPTLRKATFSFLHLVDALPPIAATPIAPPAPSPPFTHPNLETLLIGHNQSVVLSFFFDNFTLPRLRNLLLHNLGHEGAERLLPHSNLMKFLRRSNCLVNTLDLYFESLTPSQLIELLEAPSIRNTLTELSIQNDEHFAAIIDEYVLERLTLPPRLPISLPPAEAVVPAEVVANGTSPPTCLCPNLEMLGMHSCFAFSMSNFTNMLKSRLDPTFGNPTTTSLSSLPQPPPSPSYPASPTPSPPKSSPPPLPSQKQARKYLKYLETDMEPSIAAANLKPLFLNGLLTVLYDSSPTPQRLPLSGEEKNLLRRYFSEGVVLWEYDPDTGDWGPKDGILDSV